MKRWFVILLHVGFWSCYVCVIMVIIALFAKGHQGHALALRIEDAVENILFFAFLPSIVSFYTFYLILFPLFLQRKKYLFSILSGLLCVSLIATLGYYLHRYQIDQGHVRDLDHSGHPTPLLVILFMAFIATIVGVIAWVMKGFVTWVSEQRLREELMQKNHEMELAIIKAQLDPHFLFNTLNNIDTLIMRDSDLASQYLNNLSDIMRFMLYETKTALIPLSKELTYIEKYLSLYQLRSVNKGYFSYRCEGSPEGHMIAPMLLIPFIENAFKHCSNNKQDEAIVINIKISKSEIAFLCENIFNAEAKGPKEAGGLGNALIKKRLEMLYPKLHTLQYSRENGKYRVFLCLNHGKI